MNIYAQFKTVDIQPQHVDVHAGTTNSKNIRPTLWEQKDGILHGHCSAFFWSYMLSYAAFCRMSSFSPDFSALLKIAF